MTGLRPGHCDRYIERAYTRKSKFKSKGYVKAAPNSKIVHFISGDNTKTYTHQLDYVAKDDVQVRHNALESVRQIVNRWLGNDLGKNYLFTIRAHPHHIIREHKALSGAGADRMSQGMAHAFGKPIGLAAQAPKGKVLMSVRVDKAGIEKAKSALHRANTRLPGHWTINVKEIKV
ncbi:MAG: 50S ribosomal protein L16 [Nanoarchaeota archaeon]|nr:50S ribosomal protein L16 [Nanoarchaeota archaeon]